jgi:hypothetical protein
MNLGAPGRYTLLTNIAKNTRQFKAIRMRVEENNPTYGEPAWEDSDDSGGPDEINGVSGGLEVGNVGVIRAVTIVKPLTSRFAYDIVIMIL